MKTFLVLSSINVLALGLSESCVLGHCWEGSGCFVFTPSKQVGVFAGKIPIGGGGKASFLLWEA